MERSTRIVLADLVWAWIATLYLGTQLWLLEREVAWLVSSWTLGVAVTVAALVAAGRYLGEHDGVPDWVARLTDRPASLAFVVLIALLGVCLVFSWWPNHLTRVVFAAMAGLGVGLTTYRFWYGVVRPVPPERLARHADGEH